MKETIASEVGEFLKEKIFEYVSQSNSPVSGGGFKSTLSPGYKKFKTAQGLPGKANLEFSGEMLDSVDYKVTRDGVEIGVYGRNAAAKADGHNNFSGDSELPLRQFLPKEGQRFKADIDREIQKIIDENSIEAVQISRSDLATIATSAELWDLLKDEYGDMARTEIVDAISRNSDLFNLLDEFNLLRFLRGQA